MGLRRNLIAVATVVAAGVSVFGAPIDAAGGVTVSGKFADAGNCNGSYGPGSNCTISASSAFTITSAGSAITVVSASNPNPATCVNTDAKTLSCTPNGAGTITFRAT